MTQGKRVTPTFMNRFAALALGSGLLAGCTTWAADYQGSGSLATAKRELPSFHAVHVHGSADVEASVGSSQSLELTWDDNLLEHVRTTVENGKLKISMAEGSFSSKRKLVVKLTATSLDGMALHGSGDARISGVAGTSFDAAIHGSGNVLGTGSADAVSVVINGSGNVDLRALKAQSAEVEINGSGDVHVFASQAVDASIRGSGDVRYYGDPKEVKTNVAGSGDIGKG